MNKLRTLLLISLVFLFSCTQKKEEDKKSGIHESETLIEASFITGSANPGEGVIVAYTEDLDSLWDDTLWLSEIRSRMAFLSAQYPIVLLFDSEKNIPDVNKHGMEYPLHFDQHMVCGYWVYQNINSFCYGGVKKNGEFRYCYDIEKPQ